MRPLREATGCEWVWQRPRLMSRLWELRAGEDLAATLEACGWTGARMTGETAGCRWDLRHEGFFLGRTVVRREGGVDALLELRPGWFGDGTIRCADGTALRWKRGDVWGRRWRVLDPDDHVQLEFTRQPAFFKSRTTVAATEVGRGRPDLPELVLLGFFQLRLLERQSSAS